MDNSGDNPPLTSSSSSSSAASMDIPLHRAGSTEIVTVLLRVFPEGVGVRNNDGNIPLHDAIMHYRSSEHVELLIEEGKRQNISHGGILVKNNRGQSPFSILSSQVASGIDIAYISFPLFKTDLRLWDNLNILLQAYSEEVEDEESQGRHHAHRSHGHFRILHSLISKSCPPQAICLAQIMKPDQIKEADEKGRYPLSLAASQRTTCRKSILLKLLKAFPQAIHRSDYAFGRYPLHWACASGRPFSEGTKEIYDAEPAINSIRDNGGMVPFMLAASAQEPSVDTIYSLLRQCPETLE
jgi:hypothetical protein